MNIIIILLMVFLLRTIPRYLIKGEEEVFNFNFHQSDYYVEPGHVEVLRYSNSYVNYISTKTFKYNRTFVAHNFTVNFKIDIGNDLQVVSQTYKFASNEYRLFPIRVQVKVCKGMMENIMGFGKIKCGNFTGCPFVKGKIYHACNFGINPEKLPPYLPTGSYMMQMEFLYLDKEVYVLNAYGKVWRNITGK